MSFPSEPSAAWTLLIALCLIAPPLDVGAQTPDSTGGASSGPSCGFTGSVTIPDSLDLYPSSSPRLGPQDAPVKVAEFYDPGCPHCRTFHKRVLPKLTQSLPSGSIAFYLRPYPLSQQSVPLFYTLYFADDRDKFSKMLDVMFTFGKPPSVSRSTIQYYARAAGLPPKETARAITRDKYKTRLQRAMSLKDHLGIEGTPTLIINGRRISRSSYQPKCLLRLLRQEQSES